MRRYIILVIALFFLLLFIGSPLRQIYAPYKYRGLVKHYAEKYSLDWLLVASIIYHESRFRYWAESKRGARGLMQVMPETGQEIAKKLGWQNFSADDLFKPKVNLEMGCYYFSRMFMEFNNDTRIALAAYNAGKGSIYRSFSSNKNNLSYPTNYKMTQGYPDIYKYLYPETRQYVNRVMCTYKLLKMMNRMWKL